jgi:hypothetical protein
MSFTSSEIVRPLCRWPVKKRTALLSLIQESTLQAGETISRARPLKRNTRVRTLALVGHVCNVNSDEPTLPQLMKVAPLQFTNELFDEWIKDVGVKIFTHLKDRAPPLHLFTNRLISWNVTSLLDLTSPAAKKKIKLIQMHLLKGPVFLQETKWDTNTPGLLEQQLGTIQIAASRASISDKGAPCGGVAIILPTYLCGKTFKIVEIVPGYVIQVEVMARGQPRTYLSVYLPPDKQGPVIEQWDRYWNTHPPMGDLYIGGDFNLLKGEAETSFLLFRNKYRLMDVWETITESTGEGLREKGCTFRYGNGDESQLDRWLVRDPLFSQGGMKANLRTLWMSRLSNTPVCCLRSLT